MGKLTERVTIGGKSYRKFIPYPAPVNDGTVRCIMCGQIDEPRWHDDRECPATNAGRAALKDSSDAR